MEGALEERQPPESQGPGEGGGPGAEEGKGRGRLENRARPGQPWPPPAHQAPQPPPVTTPAVSLAPRGPGQGRSPESSRFLRLPVQNCPPSTLPRCPAPPPSPSPPGLCARGPRAVPQRPPVRGCQSHALPQRCGLQPSRQIYTFLEPAGAAVLGERLPRAPGDAEGRAGRGTEPHAAGPGRQPRAPPGTCAEKAPPLKPACGGPPAPDGQAVLRFGETLDMDRGRHARPAREVGGSARAAPTAIHSELVASPEGAAAAGLRTPRVDGPLPKLRGERQDRRASARAPRQTPAGPAGSPGTPCAGDPTGRRGGGRRGVPAILPNGARGGPCAGRACTCPQRRLAEHAPRAAGRPGARRWDGPGASWGRGAAHTPVAVLPSGPTSSPRTEWTRRGQAAMLGGADS